MRDAGSALRARPRSSECLQKTLPLGRTRRTRRNRRPPFALLPSAEKRGAALYDSRMTGNKQFSERDAERRSEATLKRLLATAPRPATKRKPGGSPKKRGRPKRKEIHHGDEGTSG